MTDADEPQLLILDGITFTPIAGTQLHEEAKVDAAGEWSEWKPARSAAEARAYIVSKIRQ